MHEKLFLLLLFERSVLHEIFFGLQFDDSYNLNFELKFQHKGFWYNNKKREKTNISLNAKWNLLC